MPSPFNGRWNLVSVDNGLAYYESIKSPEEYKQRLLALAEAIKKDPTIYVEQITVEGNKFHRQAWINGEKKKDSGEVEFNVERSANIGDGRAAKITLTKESETKLVRKEVGDGFNLTSTFEVKGSEMILTMSSGSATTTEKYTRVA